MIKRCWKYKAYFSVRAGRGSDWPLGFHWSSEVKPNSDPASLWAAWFTDRKDGFFFFSLLESSADCLAKVSDFLPPLFLEFQAALKKSSSLVLPIISSFIYLCSFLGGVGKGWHCSGKTGIQSEIAVIKNYYLICMNTWQIIKYYIFCQGKRIKTECRCH